jgi:peptide/nickel transport system substrate-binding protein
MPDREGRPLGIGRGGTEAPPPDALVSDVRAGRLTRRQLVQHATVLGLSLPAIGALLAACGGDDEEAAAPPAATGAGEEATTATTAAARGGVAQIALGAGTLKENLDPAIAAGTTNNFAIGQVSELLLELDPDTWEPSAGLAETWETNADASEWTLVLREAEWHDGKPLTAQDAAYSLARHLDEATGSALFSNFSPFLDPDGIEAVDDRTLRLRLKQPNSFFYLALGIHRAQIVQDGTTDFEALVGTGPFRVQSFTPGQSFELDRNPGYWQPDVPFLDGVRGVAIPEVAGQVRSVVSGESHIATDVDFTASEEAERSGGDLEVIFKKSEQILPIVLDVTKEPFGNRQVRDALKLAIGRQQVVDVAFHGLGETGNDFPAPPSDTAFFPPDLPPPEQNAEEARRLLAEGGYPDGLELTLLASQAGAAMMDEAVVLADSVAGSGFRIKVEQVPAETYWDQIWLTRPMYVSNWNRRHPWQFLSELFRTDAPWNESKISIPQIDELLNEAARTPEFDQQREIIWQALTLVRDDAGWIVPGWVHQLFLKKAELGGIGFRVLAGLDLRQATLA